MFIENGRKIVWLERMEMKNSCCLGCEKRVLGCHSNCSIYINQKAAYDSIKENIRQQKSKEILFNQKKLAIRRAK